jgi:hypothetical protein
LVTVSTAVTPPLADGGPAPSGAGVSTYLAGTLRARVAALGDLDVADEPLPVASVEEGAAG